MNVNKSIEFQWNLEKQKLLILYSTSSQKEITNVYWLTFDHRVKVGDKFNLNQVFFSSKHRNLKIFKIFVQFQTTTHNSDQKKIKTVDTFIWLVVPPYDRKYQ